MAVKVGIDLGTTYSVVSYVDDSGVICNIESSEGEKTTPSIVYFDPDGTTVVVGSMAREAGALNPDLIVERVKNYMGDPTFMKNINGQDMSASAISSIILKKLISDAETWLAGRGEEIEGAVITCPAYFGDAAREATRKAGEAVILSNGQNLKVLKIMDEPTAAAIAYGNSRPEDMNKTVLIYDLGGGTFDCTVMKLDFNGQDRKYEVITTGGDHKLGGKDWDKALSDYVRSEFCAETGCDEDSMKVDPEQIAWFSEKAEAAKKMLTQKDSTTITPSYDGQKAKIEVTVDKFNELTRGLFSQTTLLIDRMLEKANLTMNNIDEIILVGGSTRMRQVQEGLTQYYNKPLVTFDPDKAVSNGAALVASGMDVNSNFGTGSGNDGDLILDDPAADIQFGSGSLTQKGTEFEGRDGTSNVIYEKCTKSYCLRYYRGEQEAYVNLILKDTEKPARGTTATVVPDLTLSGGDPNAMVSEVPLLIMENESKNTEVEVFECDALYEEMPIPFAPPVRANVKVEVELVVDIDGKLTLTLIESDTGVRHETHPVRKGGDAASTGLDSVSKYTLS